MPAWSNRSSILEVRSNFVANGWPASHHNLRVISTERCSSSVTLTNGSRFCSARVGIDQLPDDRDRLIEVAAVVHAEHHVETPPFVCGTILERRVLKLVVWHNDQDVVEQGVRCVEQFDRPHRPADLDIVPVRNGRAVVVPMNQMSIANPSFTPRSQAPCQMNATSPFVGSIAVCVVRSAYLPC